ncbi:MAG: hypothetical protein WD738_13180 [Pirellulales bacterium]
MFRYLRIAVSALSLTACVLLIALWARSYYYLDQLTEPISRTRGIEFASIEGQARFAVLKLNPAVPFQSQDWGLESTNSKLGYAQSEIDDTKWGFVGSEIDFWTIWGPYWFLALLGVTFAAVPWIPRRFSLRAMLIAMTLFAALLGIIAASN